MSDETKYPPNQKLIDLRTAIEDVCGEHGIKIRSMSVTEQFVSIGNEIYLSGYVISEDRTSMIRVWGSTIESLIDDLRNRLNDKKITQ